jgi:ABC-type transport system involved in multi-copper enzyme maturation permease subunit
MLARVGVVAFNTYREAVRARILHGLFAAALGTGAYSLVVGAFTLRNNMRVVADLGAFFISLFGVIVAVVLTASSLYRELELKTLFPILARPIRRTEYLVGKFFGTVLTLFTFVAANVGALLIALGQLSGQHWGWAVGVGLGWSALVLGLGFSLPRWRTSLPILWAAVLAIAGWFLAAGAPDDRRVLVGLAALTLLEVCVVTGIALVFASFSTPFLTAVLTFGVFLIGRSADTLARLPVKVFGEVIHLGGVAASRVFPNLMIYVPARPLLTGEALGTPLGVYLGYAALHALAWTVGLLAFASWVFRRRDFI